MLPQELAKRLQATTGIPAKAFEQLYLGGLGTIGYWRIGGRDFRFAPVAHHLVRPDGFSRTLGLAHPPDARTWGPLVKEILASATII